METLSSVEAQEGAMEIERAAKKSYAIIVNAREVTWSGDEITYDEVVHLAYEVPPTGDNVVITVLYRRAHGNKSGTLVEGEFVKVKNGMVFDVTDATKS